MTIKKIGVLSSLVILRALVSTPSAWSEPMADQNGSGWLYGISTGVLAHDVDGLWSGARREGGVDLNVEIILNRLNLTLSTGIVRPNLARFIHKCARALHDGELEAGRGGKKGLGSRLLFRIPMEVGYTLNRHHRLSIAFAHASNAYLADPNEGLDTLGLRYSYRF